MHKVQDFTRNKIAAHETSFRKLLNDQAINTYMIWRLGLS